MRRSLRPWRLRGVPYCRSPYSAFGFRRGRPRLPRIGGMSSTRFIASSDSLRLAAVMRTASGVPLPSTSRCRLVPFLARSVGFLPVRPPKNGAEALAVHAAVLPVDALLLADPLEQGVQELLPDAAPLPVPEPAPAGHAGPAAHLLREHLPGDAAPQDEDDAGQAGPVVHRRPAPLAGASPVRRPERVGDPPLNHPRTG